MGTVISPPVAPNVHPSGPTAVGLVAGREMKVKMMSKAFVVTTVIVLGLLMLAVLLAPRLGDLFGGDGKKVAVTAETSQVVQGLGDSYKPQVMDSAEAAKDAVRNGDADAAVITDKASPAGITVVGLDSPRQRIWSRLCRCLRTWSY